MNRRSIALGVLLLSGCAPEVSVTKVNSTIAASTQLVDFGTISVGSTAERTVELWAVEGNDTELFNVLFPDDADEVFAWEGGPGVIPSSGVLEVPLSFTPTAAGQYLSVVQLVADTESTDDGLFLVRGIAGQARGERSPGVLDLGPIDIGGEGSGIVTVVNTGAIEFTLTALTVSPSNCVVEDAPLTVPVGEDVQIEVRCAAEDDAPLEGELVFDNDGGFTLAPVIIRMNDCENASSDLYDTDGDGYASCASDCDDSDPDARPGGTEVCDGVDNDCDGTIDEGTECYDDDGDGLSENDGDCNDGNAEMTPEREEVPSNGIDDDCDGVIDQGSDDADADGYTVPAGDCDDGDRSVYPGAPELEDGIDNDCDGTTDEGTAAYDDDRDGMTENDGDCDDTDSSVYAGAPEQPDWIDNDCDGTVDEGTTRYDDDGDGYTEIGGDCDDGDASVGPGEMEVIGNGVDDDCDGTVE